MKTRSYISNLIKNYITDNGNNEITAEQLRTILNDINESMLNLVVDAPKLGLSEYQPGYRYRKGQAVIYQGDIFVANQDTEGNFNETHWNILLKNNFNLNVFLQKSEDSKMITAYVMIDRNVNYKPITLNYKDSGAVLEHVAWFENPIPPDKSMTQAIFTLRPDVLEGVYEIEIIANDGKIERNHVFIIDLGGSTSCISSMPGQTDYHITSGRLTLGNMLGILNGIEYYQASGVLNILSGGHQIGLQFNGVINMDNADKTILHIMANSKSQIYFGVPCIFNCQAVIGNWVKRDNQIAFYPGLKLNIIDGQIALQ